MNNYNQAKIDHQLDYINAKIEGYFTELDALDQGEDEPPSVISQQRTELKQHIEKQLHLDDHYNNLSEQLELSGQRQISTVDEDARVLILHRNIVEVGYNVQTVVDDILQSKSLAVLADKGYHNGAQLVACEQDNNLQTYVSMPHSKTGPEGYRKADFEYDKASHTYRCPKGQVLKTNGRWYWKNSGQGRRPYRIQRFTLDYQTCLNRPTVERCNKGGLKSRYGKYIEGSEYDDAIEANAQRIAANPDIYRKRQAIVEHPFGTIKRSWSYSYFLVKGLEQVNGEAALMYFAYNLRRSMSILGIKVLLSRLKVLKLEIKEYFRTVRSYGNWNQLTRSKTSWRLIA